MRPHLHPCSGQCFGHLATGSVAAESGENEGNVAYGLAKATEIVAVHTHTLSQLSLAHTVQWSQERQTGKFKGLCLPQSEAGVGQ